MIRNLNKDRALKTAAATGILGRHPLWGEKYVILDLCRPLLSGALVVLVWRNFGFCQQDFSFYEVIIELANSCILKHLR